MGLICNNDFVQRRGDWVGPFFLLYDLNLVVDANGVWYGRIKLAMAFLGPSIIEVPSMHSEFATCAQRYLSHSLW